MRGAVAALGRGWTDSLALWRAYKRLPITLTLADFVHTFSVISPSVTRTLDDSNLPLTWNYFCLALYWLIKLSCLISPSSKFHHISWCAWRDRAWNMYSFPIWIPFLFFLLFASDSRQFSNCFRFPLKVRSSYRESIVLIHASQERIIGQSGGP